MYHFKCVCGEEVASPKMTGTCPHCGREFELRWQAEYRPTEWPTLLRKVRMIFNWAIVTMALWGDANFGFRPISLVPIVFNGGVLVIDFVGMWIERAR